MPGTDVALTFGADTSALNAGMAQARQAVGMFNDGLKVTKGALDLVNSTLQTTVGAASIVRDGAIALASVTYVVVNVAEAL